MQFTPQQLMGFGGYGHKTLVGNWSEDLRPDPRRNGGCVWAMAWGEGGLRAGVCGQLKQEKLQSFVAKVQTGSLLSQAIHRKVTQHMARAAWACGEAPVCEGSGLHSRSRNGPSVTSKHWSGCREKTLMCAGWVSG